MAACAFPCEPNAGMIYMYNRIYLRGSTNRHIPRAILSFHRQNRD